MSISPKWPCCPLCGLWREAYVRACSSRAERSLTSSSSRKSIRHDIDVLCAGVYMGACISNHEAHCIMWEWKCPIKQRYVWNVSHEPQDSYKVHEEEVQLWGTGRSSLKGQKEHVGNVSHGPKNHCSFVTIKKNMWYIYHTRWVDKQGQECNVGNVSHEENLNIKKTRYK
jgi:hypothetical protein